jgi:hypothetical protein
LIGSKQPPAFRERGGVNNVSGNRHYQDPHSGLKTVESDNGRFDLFSARDQTIMYTAYT